MQPEAVGVGHGGSVVDISNPVKICAVDWGRNSAYVGTARIGRSLVTEFVKTFGPIFIGTICIGALSLGLWFLFNSVIFRCRAVRTVGKVIQIHSQLEEVQRSSENATWTAKLMVYYPIIEFEDTKGVVQVTRGNLGHYCTPKYRVGDDVPILYIPNNTKAIRIDSFMSLYWNAACLLFIAGCGSLILAFWLYFV